jgi:hypothetical protein
MMLDASCSMRWCQTLQSELPILPEAMGQILESEQPQPSCIAQWMLKRELLKRKENKFLIQNMNLM